MLRVEKHREAKQDRKRKALQLKSARNQLKRVRRASEQSQKLVGDGQAPRSAQPESQAQTDLADFRLLRSVRLGYTQKPSQTESRRLEVMMKEGYVVLGDEQTYRLSGKGLLLLGQLRKRVSSSPGTDS